MSCSKHQHESIFTAQKQAVSLSRHKNISLNRIRIYICQCGCWHVTQMSYNAYLKSKQR
jgi:hypothetical protein